MDKFIGNLWSAEPVAGAKRTIEPHTGRSNPIRTLP